MVGSLPDVITCAKFQVEILGVTILQGAEFPISLLISEWALQQCSATALPVKQIRQITGFFSYFRDYIQNCSALAKPLTD